MAQPQVLAELQDGFTCDMTFDEGALSVKGISGKGPSLKGPGPIDQTTMKNTAVTTALPGALISIGDMTQKVAYATEAHDQLMSQMLLNQEITWEWPDGSSHVIWGWIESFEVDEMVINGRPTATITVHASNLNATGVETAPVYTEAA